MPNAEALFKVEVTGANHTHFANICDIGNRLISLGITKDQWDAFGRGGTASALHRHLHRRCVPIAEAHRLQNLYMVAHFRRFLLGQVGYNQFLTAAYAETNEPAVSFESK